jgi:polyisoprenoid-binding protein YceI
MTILGKGTVFALALLAYTGLATAQRREIDVGKSRMTVRVSKAGIFSAFGHEHEIGAPITQGAMDAAAGTVELRVTASSLKVLDPNTSDADRTEIQSTMLGPKVLDAGRYPDIVFRSTKTLATSSGSWRVDGDLTLHGQTRPITVQVRQNGENYVGNARFRQTEFGIQPVTVAGGAIRVKDELLIEFDIQVSR